ncbi:multidrug resistance-associated protein 5 [Tanacetum coccineum]
MIGNVNPLEYVHFDSRVIDDFSFDVTALKLLKNNEDLGQFVKACYENNLKIDLFTKHNGYDIMEMIHEDLHPRKPVGHVDSNSDSDGETNVPLDDVAHVVKQFEHENKGNVNIPRMTTDDPWLNKLVEDPDDEQVDYKFKAKHDVSYPFFNHGTPWNKCKPVLGMRFETLQQLKHMLANYGVQHGYQLCYMQNNHNKLLAFCGRDVIEGKCDGLKGMKPKIVDDDECETSKQGSKKGDGRKVVNETHSKVVKERWNKKKKIEKKRAKQCALFDHKGGLVDHYSKLWRYRQEILDTNSGSTYVLENEVNDEDGKLYFGRFYVCFHGVKQGWLEGCRKIIGLDGCFLTQTYKGQLLTTMGRDANNQMFPIAWAIVGVENNMNWSWFLSLIRDDLNLGDGRGINIISDGQKDYFKLLQTGYLMLSTYNMPGTFMPISRRDGVGYSLRGFFELSGIPCVNVMAGYMHLKMNPDYRVAKWYSQCKWPKKRRIRYPIEDDDHVLPKVGRVMHCNKRREIGHNKTRCLNQERLKPAYLRSKGIVFHEVSSTSNTMPPPPTPSSSNTMLPSPTPSPSTSNTMPPPSGSNTMPPPPKPSSSNTIPSHAILGSNTNTGSNTMPSASTRTNKGKCPLIPKKRGKPAKSNAFSSIGGSKGGATTRGLRDEASDEEHQFNMDMEVVYQFEREQITIDEDDQFWEECAMEFDHVEEHGAQDKGMQDVATGKQPMLEDVAAGKQPMIEDEPLQGGVDLPTQESIIEANPKPTRSKAVEVPNKMRIFHKNRGRSERIFNHKMKNLQFDEHGTGSTPDKAFDVE